MPRTLPFRPRAWRSCSGDRFSAAAVVALVGWACTSGGLRKRNVDASGTGGAEPGAGGVSSEGGTTGSGGTPAAVGGASGLGGTTTATSTGGNGGLGGQAGRDGAANLPREGGADPVGSDAGRDRAPPAVDTPLLGAGGVPLRDAGAGGAGGKTGGVGGTSTLDAGFPGVGGALGDFCVGTQSKVEYRGRTFVAPTTSKYTDHELSCCFAVAATLHTYDSIGRDIDAVVTFRAGYRTAGMVTVEASSGQVRAAMRSLLHSDSSGAPVDDAMTGAVWLSDAPFASQPWTMGLCLAVEDPASPLQGTKVYVPGVTVAAGEWANRLRLWLLKDSSLTAVDADKANLDTLELASDPLLDLSQIAFVDLESSSRSYFEDTPCMWVGLDTPYVTGSTLKSKVLKPGSTTVDLRGVPFVVEADGQRIYLGSFTTLISSVGSRGPQIYVENIDDDGLPIYPPSGMLTDPRTDPRILKVLGDLGKSLP